MKKIFIGTLMILAISSTGFAKMHDFQNEPTPPVPPHMMKMKNNNYRVNPELERARILIEEKRLEVRKELLNEKPDWNKIEKCVLKVALSK